MRKSRIASPVPHPESSLRHLPLVDLLVDIKTGLLELALRAGLKVFTTMPARAASSSRCWWASPPACAVPVVKVGK